MIAAFGFSLLGMVLWQAATPPDIAGKWTGEEWGKVVLEQKQPGKYEGTYTDTIKDKPGTIQVKWSRVERRYNGTWREGADRYGKISLRLVDNEIRGAWTTNKKSGINPGTPELADLLWVRRGSEAPDLHREIEKRVQINTILIRVVDESNKPIENVTVFRNHVYAPRESQRYKIENARFRTDARGTTAINLSGTSRDVRLWVTKDGFVPLHAMWAIKFQSDGDAIPDEFTFVMKRGTEIGGIVVDEMARAIPGVRIEVQDMTVSNSDNPKRPGSRPVRAYMLAEGNAVVTDSQGRWALNNVPSDEVLLAGRSNESSVGEFGEPLRTKQPLKLRFIHPRYAENEWGWLQLKHDVTLDSLRAKTAKVVLRSGAAAEKSSIDKSTLPKVSDNFQSHTKVMSGLVSSAGIIERIEDDTIQLRSGDHFVVRKGTIVLQPKHGNQSIRILKPDVLEPGMAIAYAIRDGKVERLVLVGIVEQAPGGKSVFDTIKELRLWKGSELTDSIDGRHPIRLTSKDGEVAIKIGETKLIKLPKPTKSIEWRAGDFKPETIEDFEPFDYLLVRWRSNGRITWTCYQSPAVVGEEQNGRKGSKTKKVPGK